MPIILCWGHDVKQDEIKKNPMATNKIGEHLLKGWTLLGDSCPNECHTPLMRSPDRKSLICFECNTDFLANAHAATQHQQVISKASEGTDGAKPGSSEIPDRHGDVSSSLLAVVDDKIHWAVQKLATTENVEELQQLSALIESLMRIRSCGHF